MPSPDQLPDRGIDPRGPRFSASVTALTLLVDIVLGVLGLGSAGARIASLVLLAVIVVVFVISTFAGIQRHPYGQFFRRVIRPRLKPPTELEDPRPPTFAQGVGLVVTGLGLLIGILVPVVVPVAAGLAFVAAFLNAVFGLCIGCQLYLALVRAGLIRRAAATA